MIDEVDRKILRCLEGYGRLSYSEIGKIVGLSRTSVRNRVAEMEESGVIAGYKAVIRLFRERPRALFVMNVETEASRFAEAKRKLAEAEETVTVVRTTGNCHLVAICAVRDADGMREFVSRAYDEIEGILAVNVRSVLEVVKGDPLSVAGV